MKSFALLLAPVALAATAAVAQPAQTTAPAPAAAQPSAQFSARANDVVRVINGEGDPAEVFNAAFLAQVPADRIRGMSEQIRSQMGRATGIEQVQAAGANQGTFLLRFERGAGNAQMALDADAPHKISSLLLRPAS